MIPIDDPDDPRVEPYRAVRDRDLAGRAGRFLVEGEIGLRLLLSSPSRFRAESVLLSEARAVALAATLDRLAPGMPVFAAARAVMDRIAGFPIHRGVLACALRGLEPSAADVLGISRSLVLGLIGLANHDNVGGAFRNAAAFGAEAVLLDRTACDPLYRKAIRVSAGACLTVPFSRGGDVVATVRTLAEAGFEPLALSPRGEEPLRTFAWPKRAALLVGAEGPGLPSDLLRGLRTVRIDMAAGFDSLNVATATGIALAAAHGAGLGGAAG